MSAIATETIAYPARTSALEEPRVYRLGSDTLYVARQPKVPVPDAAPPLPLAIPLSAITQVRLRYFPTRVQTNRYECIITTSQHGEFKITNQVYEGLMQFKDQSAEFRTFALELCRRVAAVNPQARFVRGRTLWLYLLEHAFLLGMLVLLGLVLWMVGGAVRGLVIVKLLIIAFYVPTVVRYARRNWPAPFAPHHVPDDVVPRPAPADRPA